MNKLKYLMFALALFGLATATEREFVESDRSRCMHAFNGLIKSLEPGKAVQVLFNLEGSEGFQFKTKDIKPYQFLEDEWKLVAFGWLSILGVEGMILRFFVEHGDPNLNACFTMHWEEGHISLQLYRFITKASEIPDSIRTNINPCHVYAGAKLKDKDILPSVQTHAMNSFPNLQEALKRLAFERKCTQLFLSSTDELVPYKLCKIRQMRAEDKAKYVPTLLVAPFRVKNHITIPGLGIWYDGEAANPFFTVRLNKAPTEVLRCLVISELINKDNLKEVFSWFSVTDPQKGVYFDSEGKLSAAENFPKDERNIAYIVKLVIERNRGAWILDSPEGVKIIPNGPKFKEDTPAPEQKPAEQSTSPGSSRDVPATVPAAVIAQEQAIATVESEAPKINIPDEVFKEGLEVRTNIILLDNSTKPLMQDKILFHRDGAPEYARKDHNRTEAYNLTEVLLRLTEGKIFSLGMTMDQLRDLLDTINKDKNFEKLGISRVEHDSEKMKGKAPVVFALFKDQGKVVLAFGTGKFGTKLKNKAVLKGGVPV